MVFNSFRRFYSKHKGKIPTFNKTTRRPFSSLENRLLRLKWPLVYYLLGANVGVYLAWNSGIFTNRFMFANFSLSKANMSLLRLHTLVTYNFSHMHFLHLLSNCVGLYFIGRTIEGIFGPRVLLMLYLAGGVAGGIVSLMGSSPYDMRPTIGASASLSALLGFFVMNFPHQKIYIFPIPFGISAWIVGAFYFFYSLRHANDPFSPVQHKGHFTGLLAGAAYYYIFHQIPIW